MIIRFGYVAMALNILDGSPNKTITHTNLMKLHEQKDRLARLRRITKTNLECLLRVLKYNAFSNIHVFRITSKLIPLATHPVTADWDYIGEFKDELTNIGKYIHQNNMRVSAHPDHFTLLNTPNETVFQTSVATLTYHAKLFQTMGLDDSAKLVLHIGGLYGDKPSALKRFHMNFEKLPDSIKNRIIIENDDKVFTAEDALQMSTLINAPVVFDVHHHNCCNTGESLEALWPRLIKTWRGSTPKVHFSSPRSEKSFRAHADFIEAQEFYAFVQQVKIFNCDFDVMIEAKQKDIALFKLMTDLKDIFKIRIIDDATIEI
ncbi:UV DNA damage repair endonuclease UvsE [Anaerosinus massiliensis]|uniref:UV DNA damage repair endonuclease UvsE n=1 Tax=Massilibacillus massiliensis TaxID=1806837 RepID=UPI000DA5FCF7|nr:UV DNA damage repair endonuclease UvsE [Massilibacillus massiliensis]